MYEICALLRQPKKAKKPAAPKRKAIRVGARALLQGREVTIIRRDDRFVNAWFVSHASAELPYSVSRTMLKVL